MNILILTAADDEIREIGDLSAANKMRYAKMHGYSFVYATAYLPWCNWQGADRSWNKIPLIQKYLASYDWIWWSDADSLIRNYRVRLEDILDTDKDLVIGKDHQPFAMPHGTTERVGMINAGNFFIRNCEWSAGFLAQVVNSTWIEAMGYYHREQGAMIRLLEDPENELHVEYVPIRMFNSYSDHHTARAEVSWKIQDVYQEGDFVIHWAGTVPSNAGVLAEMRQFKRRFGILTLCSGAMREQIGDFAAKGKQAYADRHGYDFLYETELLDPTRDGSWNKIPWLQKYLPCYEWLLWSDADCIISNGDIRLEDILGGADRDLVIGRDHQPCLNAGNFFIRNCAWSFDFLKRVYARADQPDFLNGRWNRGGYYAEREQGVMQAFFETKPDCNHVDIRPVRDLGFSYRMNRIRGMGFTWAYPDFWKPGDFLKHYNGWVCSEAHRLTNMWNPLGGGSTFIPLNPTNGHTYPARGCID